MFHCTTVMAALGECETSYNRTPTEVIRLIYEFGGWVGVRWGEFHLYNGKLLCSETPWPYHTSIPYIITTTQSGPPFSITPDQDIYAFSDQWMLLF